MPGLRHLLPSVLLSVLASVPACGAELVSILPDGSPYAPAGGVLKVSADGRYVLFAGAGGTNGVGTATASLYLRDRVQRTTTLVTDQQLLDADAGLSGDGSMVIAITAADADVGQLQWFPQGTTIDPEFADAYTALLPATGAPAWVATDQSGDHVAVTLPVNLQRWRAYLHTRSTVTTQGLDRCVALAPGQDAVALSPDAQWAVDQLQVLPQPTGTLPEDQLALVNLATGTRTILPGSTAVWDDAPDEVAVATGATVVAYLGFIGSGFGVVAYSPSTGQSLRVDTSAQGVPGNGYVAFPSISADGALIGFISSSTNLVPGVTDGAWHAYVANPTTHAITMVSVGAAGQPVPTNGWLTGDGQGVVAFSSATGVDPHYPTLVGGAYYFPLAHGRH